MNPMDYPLEFQIILNQLADCAISDTAKEKSLALRPFLSERECQVKTKETTEARTLLDAVGTPPLTTMHELEKILLLAQKGSMLLPEQLTGVARFLISCKRMKAYLKKGEPLDISLAYFGNSFQEIPELYQEIERAIENDDVADEASPMLKDLRRKLENLHASVKAKLDSMLRGKKEWYADSYVTIRSGRLVLPVKREYKNQVPGLIIETSATKSTYFIEPSAVRKLQEEIDALRIEEENEKRRILYTLTALVDDAHDTLLINKECMETLDFAFAKAKLSVQMRAIPVPVIVGRKITICQGRHPLLPPNACVPLDFVLGDKSRGVVITGPNTGGKTVALKTVGLLSMMAQSGLHVPVGEGSQFCMRANVLCDIGDGQSITENLSTFSAHLTNMIEILRHATDESLVLLDELGSGTDPAEGMGIAISVLEELLVRQCLFIVTTHYAEVKEYAKKTEGLMNARMDFDRETLEPLYHLCLGEAGESCALYIAQKLGFPSHMLKRAYAAVYEENIQSVPRREVPVLSSAKEAVFHAAPAKESQIRSEPVEIKKEHRSEKFHIGDSVRVYPQKELGIVFKTSDDKGMIGVQIQKKKQFINHKRLKLMTAAKELYPENYDFSILFDTVENRKARHKMEKKHQPGVVISCDNQYDG